MQLYEMNIGALPSSVLGYLFANTISGFLFTTFHLQIRRSLLNEDEYGFRRAKRPIYYYDEGLEVITIRFSFLLYSSVSK